MYLFNKNLCFHRMYDVRIRRYEILQQPRNRLASLIRGKSFLSHLKKDHVIKSNGRRGEQSWTIFRISSHIYRTPSQDFYVLRIDSVILWKLQDPNLSLGRQICTGINLTWIKSASPPPSNPQYHYFRVKYWYLTILRSTIYKLSNWWWC
jgi:hypothetical protein